ncbi:CotH kinase family protein [Candidatus Saccharibacteria bacterium]|nr:CotH kinase family protein [Candidatus Saccharibacteria bacterium]
MQRKSRAKRKAKKAPQKSTQRITHKTTTAKSSTITRSLLFLIIIFITVITVLKISEYLAISTQKTFPKLEISLASVPLEQINLDTKDVKYSDNTAIFTIDKVSSTFQNVEIKGRGNFSWVQAKKSYQLKLPSKESLFGHNPAKKWNLISNYTDPTYLRNDTAFYLEKILNEPYALNGNFIEVYFDGNYNGLYYLTEKVEINKSRINLQDHYGILVELDNLYGTADTCYYDINHNCLTIKDSPNPDDSKSAMAIFINKLNAAEQAISAGDYQTLDAIIDTESFARYFLLNEFTNNPDAYSSSLFLYQNDENDKIHAGPGWDFDLAFGNKHWPTGNVNANLVLSPASSLALKQLLNLSASNEISSDTRHVASISTLFFDLLELPEFETKVKQIYQSTLSGHGEELLTHIKSQANYIRDAAYRDQARWKFKTDFDEEADYLIDWVAKRYEYFEETYGASSDAN